MEVTQSNPHASAELRAIRRPEATIVRGFEHAEPGERPSQRRARTIDVLMPPNAKLFVIATSIFARRASPLT